MAAVIRAQRMNSNIWLWGRGVDREQFHPGRRDASWRRKLGIADSERVVAFLGRLVMEKGLETFAATIDVLKSRAIHHRVVVIGEGPARSWFEKRLPDAIFIGHQEGDGLASALASAEILLNPSTTETFGNVTLESMACAVPVVAARSTGAASLIKNDENGRLVEPGDAEAFADAVAIYLNDDAERMKHGSAALAFAQTQNWDEINASVIEVYRKLSSVKRRAG
jgi:glycosyltransferase involved in cell wall biosynthesis